jgi:hypothetical protein
MSDGSDTVTVSLRQIAARMDPIDPPVRASELLRYHRWLGTLPGQLPDPLPSLGTMARRHSDAPGRQIRFLTYNTWLLSISIDFVHFLVQGIGSVADVIVCLGLDPVEALERAVGRRGNRAVCLALIPLVPAGFPVLGVGACLVLGADKFVKLALDAGVSPIRMLEALGVDVEELLDLFDIRLPLHTEEKPIIEERAEEIGKAVAQGYDLISLLEVWDEASVRRITSAWPVPPPHHTGPVRTPGSYKNQDSGLLVISPTLPLAEQGPSHIYQTDGVTRHLVGECELGPLVDSDRWANKAVMLTYVDVGLGTLELYSTHLYSGGGMPPELGLGMPGPTPEEKINVRNAQVDEIVEFYRLHHNPANVALLAGDFNIPGRDSAQYGQLVDRLAAIGLDDLWMVPVYGNSACEGITNRHGEKGRDEPDDATVFHTFDATCQRRTPDPYRPVTNVPDDYYCNDRAGSNPDHGSDDDRIDYIFVERPSASHTFNLDVSRVRRRPFKRLAETADEPYLSDHIGLEVDLLVSAREPV